ncbi:MAG TPA: DegT/DnrJ/EryC1/StrS family aminotransferase [Thermoleophilaceae bacterium]|nr:DegT/DnrJ/EryC1/StrS family aminotransferase [Thermoleophilaceae bacterium]
MHAELKSELLADMGQLIDSGAFVDGGAVRAFEEAFARFCGRSECVGTSSGLDALRLALIAAGIGPGDEVVLPAQTFVATLEAVVQAGATPVLADVSESDYNLDPQAAAAAAGESTRALLPVHLYGQLADMNALAALAGRLGCAIVEDACQAHGARRDGHAPASAGSAAAFSFYPSKNLGAFGDAGACVTGEPELAATVRALRQHGQRERHRHDLVGYTARLDTVQAHALLRKLPLLAGWNEQRRVAASAYTVALEGVGDLMLPPVAPGSQPVWHVYVVRTAEPERLGGFLAERGIGTGRHYPVPLHLAPAYAHLGHGEGEFPVAEALSRQGISLPIFPGITEPELDAVGDAVKAYFKQGS